MVRFYRGNYSDYWAWTDAATDRWERMLNWIGARQISAVDISAITGSFEDLNVTGQLAAGKVDAANIRELTELWDGTQEISHDAISITTTGQIRNFTQFAATFGFNTGTDRIECAAMFLFDSATLDTTWRWAPPVTNAVWGGSVLWQVQLSRNTTHTQLRARARFTTTRRVTEGINIFKIFGVGTPTG